MGFQCLVFPPKGLHDELSVIGWYRNQPSPVADDAGGFSICTRSFLPFTYCESENKYLSLPSRQLFVKLSFNFLFIVCTCQPFPS